MSTTGISDDTRQNGSAAVLPIANSRITMKPPWQCYIARTNSIGCHVNMSFSLLTPLGTL